MLVVLALAFLVYLFWFVPAGGDGTPEIVDRIMNLIQANDEHVSLVRYGTPIGYPDITYGDAFETFFDSPTWKYFRVKKEGTEPGREIVEFTGTCFYQDMKVKARLQFTLGEDGNTFQATYLSFNKVPQSLLVMYALIGKAFSEYPGR